MNDFPDVQGAAAVAVQHFEAFLDFGTLLSSHRCTNQRSLGLARGLTLGHCIANVLASLGAGRGTPCFFSHDLRMTSSSLEAASWNLRPMLPNQKD